MKKFIQLFGIVLSFCLTLSVQAQDKIIMNSGEIIEAQVNEISKSEIKYKSKANPDGPSYVLKKAKVKKIVYSNGLEDNFQAGNVGADYKHNGIYYHIMDVIYNDFKFSYEHITKNGKLGITIPLSLGFNTAYSGTRDYVNLFYTGVGFNIYPTGQHRVTYFMGPELNIGYGKDSHYYRYYDDGSYDIDEPEFVYGRLIVNNGLTYNPVPNFRVMILVGVGVRYYDIGEDNYDSGLQSTGYFSLTMGYMF